MYEVFILNFSFLYFGRSANSYLARIVKQAFSIAPYHCHSINKSHPCICWHAYACLWNTTLESENKCLCHTFYACFTFHAVGTYSKYRLAALHWLNPDSHSKLSVKTFQIKLGKRQRTTCRSFPYTAPSASLEHVCAAPSLRYSIIIQFIANVLTVRSIFTAYRHQRKSFFKSICLHRPEIKRVQIKCIFTSLVNCVPISHETVAARLFGPESIGFLQMVHPEVEAHHSIFALAYRRNPLVKSFACIRLCRWNRLIGEAVVAQRIRIHVVFFSFPF